MNNKILTIFIFIIIFFISNTIIFTHLNSEKKEHISYLSNMLKNEAKILFENIIVIREWNTEHKGIFVKKEGDFVEINPAQMTKQISIISNNKNKHSFNMTSLKPLNPNNKANSFEKEALHYFDNNTNKKFYSKFSKNFDNFEFMGVLKVEKSCLKCHYSQNYSIGDNIGGISINIPIKDYKEKYLSIENRHNNFITFTSIISIVIFSIIMFMILSHFNKKDVLIKNLKELKKLKNENEILAKRYDFALESSDIGIWDWDLEKDEIFFDKNWKEMLGFSQEEIKNSLDEWDIRVHPDDKEKAIEDIKNNQSGKTNSYINIHRLKHKNGDWVWILDKGKTYFDKNNKPIRMVGSHTNITQIKELELKIQEKEQNLTYAQEIAHMGHWKYYLKDDKFVISDTLKKLIGIDNSINNFSYDDLKKLIHEEDLEHYIQIHKKALYSCKKTNLQYRLKKFNSQEYIDINEYISCLSPLNNNESKVYLGSIQNITHLKNLEKDLTLFSTIINNSPLSIMITNTKGEIIYVNPYFTKVSGYEKTEIIGKNPRVLKSPLTQESVYKDLWQTITNRKTWAGVFRNLNKKNEEYWETALIIPIIDKDEIINFLAIKTEITKEIFLKKALEEKEELILNQSKNAAMGEMISMIAHQWRQPITTISMAANNILADVELDMLDTQEARKFANEVATQTQYLSNTIEDFRNFFKQEKDLEKVSIKTLFDDTSSIILASLKNNDITLKLHFHEDLVINTYRRELVQVLINIIKNAKEALVESTNEPKEIKVELKEFETQVQIQIIDNAGGIKDEIIEKVFEAYFTTKNEHNGTGLGLYMSKMIVEKHLKGTIRVFNKNNGAVFEIKLPKNID